MIFMGLKSPGLEWPYTLDVPALLADGWQPQPFREFIVKVHARCDLACDYCYVFEMADQSWRDRPRKMPDEIVERSAERIGEYARRNDLLEIALILHGGEPLLAGHDLIWRLVTATRKAAGSKVNVAARIQTNGVRLDPTYLDLFDELDLKVGVSTDGDATAHDRHRRFASGRGSHAAVAANLKRLASPRFRHLYGGLLCTVDLHNDPIATYEALASHAPPRIDFLLPHGTWDAPPPGRVPHATETPYGNWLATIFDHWYPHPRTGVRIFEDVMRSILTGVSSGEAIGLAPARMAVIETDGSVEQVDSLKAVYDGASQTGLHVNDNSLDEALVLPGMVARQLGERALAAECRRCPVHQVCGGGMYVHRYRSGTGFANPSVYCPDLMFLIRHIAGTMTADIGDRLAKRAS